MISFFDINNIFFEFLGYKMSYLEFWATLSGGIAVWLSAKENVWSWILGLVNVVLAFIMFYQIQLYPDMFLQMFFFVTNILGFWYWKFPKQSQQNSNEELKITNLDTQKKWIFLGITIAFTAIFGTFSNNLNHLFPLLFSKPTAFPYLDSFTTVVSIIATYFLMHKKLEAWWLWLFVDTISTYMYYIKEVKMYSILYLVFCFIALFGAIDWTKKYKLGLPY